MWRWQLEGNNFILAQWAEENIFINTVVLKSLVIEVLLKYSIWKM